MVFILGGAGDISMGGSDSQKPLRQLAVTLIVLRQE